MYRNQYDGCLTRSLEAGKKRRRLLVLERTLTQINIAVMILESFARLSRKEKFRIDLVGQSGEEAVIPLVALDALPTHAGDRYKVSRRWLSYPNTRGPVITPLRRELLGSRSCLCFSYSIPHQDYTRGS